MDTIRIVLADDNVLLREGISRLIGARQEFELVGVAGDLPELLVALGRSSGGRRAAEDEDMLAEGFGR